MKRTLKITKEGKMTGLKIVAGTLVILLAISDIVMLHSVMKMEKEYKEIFEEEWEEMKSDN